MSTEVRLRPGWLLKDTERASKRIGEWSEQSAPFSKSTNVKGPAKRASKSTPPSSGDQGGKNKD